MTEWDSFKRHLVKVFENDKEMIRKIINFDDKEEFLKEESIHSDLALDVLIDFALDKGDKELFMLLTDKKKLLRRG